LRREARDDPDGDVTGRGRARAEWSAHSKELAMARLRTALIFANDAERLAHFYGTGFGFPIAHSEPGWIVLDAGGCELGIHQIPQEYLKDCVITDPPRDRTNAPTKLCYDVEDFPAAMKRLEAAGARFGQPKPWDGDSARDGIDPEGNVFRISSALG
jgi:extradiol dioxygenase family protein